jgi:hypothetical protein
MTPLSWLGALIIAGLGIAATLFRKGGPYNPMNTDHISTVPDPEIVPASVPAPAAPVPRETPVKPPASDVSMLVRFCTYIRDFEGGPGSLNYQLNNPGDCRPSPVGYLPKYQPVEIIDTDTDPRYPYHKGQFAKFPTYELGWEYLVTMVHVMATNHPTWTILDFFAHFAPTSDGNAPVGYANNVAKRCGVVPSIQLKDLFA